jgi:beta-lactamase regulating signal transducer with metallopeptidase domain
MMAGFGAEGVRLASFGIQAMAENSALRIMDCLLAGSLIACFAGMVSHFSRKETSSLRFAVWFSALVALALSPFLGDAISARRGTASFGLNRAAIILPGSWVPYVFGLWAAIAALLLLRVAIGVWRLRKLRATLVPVDLGELDETVRGILSCGGRRAHVSLFTSYRVKVPAAIGLIDPIVVVPRWALDELSSDELKLVLLHEMAHLRRRDSWTNLAQQVIKAAFFFHPAVWWIERKLSLEREMACDDAVLSHTANPRAYAQCLKRVAEKSLLRRGLALAQGLLGRVRQTSMRVARILDESHSRGVRNGWRAAFSLAALLLVSGLIGANEPHFIAFRSAEPLSQKAFALHVPTATPVSFKTAEAVAPAFAGPSLPARVPAANHQISRSVPRLATARRFALPAAARRDDAGVLHFASMGTPRAQDPQPASAELFFLVFENLGFGPEGQPVYEIELVHVTVLHPSTTAARGEILHKEI